MKYYSSLDLLRFFGLFGAGLFGGWLLDYTWLGVSLAAAIWILLQHREYVTFREWAKEPLRRPEFETDAWQLGADTLFRSYKRQRKRVQASLLRMRQLQSITDALPDAAIVLDHHGCIVRFNPAAADLLRIRDRDRGLPIVELVRHPKIIALVRGGPNRGPIGREPGARDTAEREPVEFESPFDDQVRLEARLVQVGETGSLLLLRDITQLHKLLTMRQDFVANVSHELRTPLTVILGYLETLQEPDLDSDTHRTLVGRIVPPARRMHALLQDLLFLTRLEAREGLPLEGIAPIGMDTLFQRVIEQVTGPASGVHHIHIDVGTSTRLLGVPAEIESAVGNLLSNAVRYSPDGGRITLIWKDDAGGTRLEVADQGIGIAREHLSRLTERFYRVDLARARVQGGTGLGLAIVKHVLKRHGTLLQVESEPGKGSRFFCVFPPSQIVPANRQLEAVG